MNREDVAMDLTFENLDILRREVQAAKLLLSECDKVLEEDGGVYIELRAFLSGKMDADDVIALLSSQQREATPAEIARVHPEQAEGAQGERKLSDLGNELHNLSCAVIHTNEDWAEQISSIAGELWKWPDRAALAQPSPAESALRDAMAYGTGIISNGEHVPLAEALQPSPAPELERPIHWELHNTNWRAGFEAAETQHDRIVGALRAAHQLTLDELHAMEVHVAQAGRDIEAAQARVAELEANAAVSLPPFAEKVLSKLRRFYDCAEDFESGGVDIGRHWLDLLTQLGLLNRVQRSPALWEISQQGEDLLEAPVAQAGQVPEGWQLVPFNPTKDQWGGLARAIVFWMRSYQSSKHTPATLIEFITSLGHEVPEWMGDEAELRTQDHVISKGTAAALIYKAMLAAAPAQGG